MTRGELANGEDVLHYTLEEFIKTTRPDGLGHIIISDMNIDEPPTDITFDGVVCDFCNAEIVQTADPEDEVVHVVGSYAMCDACFKDTDKNVEGDDEDTR